ncbi:MAG: carbon storage regulator CsrA [Armatimonadetes bacterium]|nr:carbon storage regulator CsrA [Armatimonadota bacterium]
MLVLTRRTNQSIIIGDDIEITIVEIKGDQVRLGITAPRDITVHRKEIHEQIRQENIQAAALQAQDAALAQNLLDSPDAAKPKGSD